MLYSVGPLWVYTPFDTVLTRYRICRLIPQRIWIFLKKRKRWMEMCVSLFNQDEEIFYSLAKDLKVDPSPLSLKQVRDITSPLLNWPVETSNVPLFLTILFGDKEMCKYMIEEEYGDVNCGKVLGLSPLCLALSHSRYEIAILLIKRGANVNLFNHGKAPMCYAIREDCPVDVVSSIVEAGFPVDETICKNNNYAPLLEAVCAKNLAVVKYLIDRSANVNTITFEGATPLQAAISTKSKDVTKLLVENGANVDGLNKNDMPPLFCALTLDEIDIDILRIHLDAGAKVNRIFTPFQFLKGLQDVIIYSALQYAVSSYDVRAVELLVQYGADINYVFPQSNGSILHFLFKDKNQDSNGKPISNEKFRAVVRFLLENGANLNAKDDNGSLPIDCALSERKWIAIEEYIRHGLNSGTLKEQDKTRLFSFAIENKEANLIELCLACGVDPHGWWDEDLYRFALSNGSTLRYNSLLYFFRRIGHAPDDFYIKALRTKSSNAVRPFLKFNYPFSGVDGIIHHNGLFWEGSFASALLKCQSLLFKGIKLQDPDRVKKALEKGAEAKCCSSDIPHPLLYCAGMKDSAAATAIVKLLLEYGAPPSRLHQGKAPLSVAAMNGHLEMCKALMRHGACVFVEIKFSQEEKKNFRSVGHVLNTAKSFFNLIKRKDLIVFETLEKMLGTEECYVYMNCVNKRGNTLLGEAIRRKLDGFVERIMSIRLKMD